MLDFNALAVPVTCDCGHGFKIDPVGVSADTEIICPACGLIDSLDQGTIDRLEDEYVDSINELFDDDDTLEKFHDAYVNAPEVSVARVIA